MALTIKTIFSVLDYYHLGILHVYIKLKWLLHWNSIYRYVVNILDKARLKVKTFLFHIKHLAAVALLLPPQAQNHRSSSNVETWQLFFPEVYCHVTSREDDPISLPLTTPHSDYSNACFYLNASGYLTWIFEDFFLFREEIRSI